MKNFHLVAQGVDVTPLNLAIHQQPHLWNQHRERLTAPGTPHSEVSDIWVRYNDVKPFEALGDYSKFNDEHDSVWYPAFYALPPIRRLVFDLMARVDGERLGGVLITKIPPGGKIAPHSDHGWHVDYYDKYYLSLESEPGANFYCGKEMICPKVGDCWWFNNKEEHWVDNTSGADRMTLIVCIRSHHRETCA